jgi:hypothetical protein|tara:strand:- start:589 stop:756 length:168 start_codon:yes stop_codon:yes gene_type:complete
LNPEGVEDKQYSDVESYEEDEDEESSNRNQPRSVEINHQESGSASKESYHTGLDQ